MFHPGSIFFTEISGSRDLLIHRIQIYILKPIGFSGICDRLQKQHLVLVSIQRIYIRYQTGSTVIITIINNRFLISLSGFHRNHNDSGSSPGPIYRCWRSPLQNIDTLYIIGIQFINIEIRRHRHIVHDNQRSQSSCQGRYTPNFQPGSATRRTVAIQDTQTGHLSLHHMGNIRCSRLLDNFRVKTGYCSGQIFFRSRTVTDHHHLIQIALIIFHNYIELPVPLNS